MISKNMYLVICFFLVCFCIFFLIVLCEFSLNCASLLLLFLSKLIMIKKKGLLEPWKKSQRLDTS